DSYYLASYLMSPIGRQLVEREAVGSVQRHLNIEDIRALRIPMPDLSIQRAIGNKLRKAERLRGVASSIRASAAKVVAEAFGPLPALEDGDASWVDVNNLSDGRLDAWFHQRAFLAAEKLLQRSTNLIQVKSLCKLPRAVADFSKWRSDLFTYFEI